MSSEFQLLDENMTIRVLGLDSPGPYLRVEVYCAHCDTLITWRRWDVREEVDLQASDLGDTDVATLRAHLSGAHGVEV